MQCSIKICVKAGRRSISMWLSQCVWEQAYGGPQTHTSISSYTRRMNRILGGTSTCERDRRNRRRLGEDRSTSASSSEEERGNVRARVFLRDVGAAEKPRGNNPTQTSAGMSAIQLNPYLSFILTITDYIWCALFIEQKAWKEWK